MAKRNKNPKVEFYFLKESRWRKEQNTLRGIILDCGLTEELKWGVPCYTLEGSNVVLIHAFKDYCAVLFMKGALLKDRDGVLIQQTENVQSARQIRFTHLREVTSAKGMLTSYIREAVALEKAGAKVTLKKTTEFKMPDEFRHKLEDSKVLQEAFYALTPGRQRGYLLHFSSAKQSTTRESRIAKCIPQIMKGKGLDD